MGGERCQLLALGSCCSLLGLRDLFVWGFLFNMYWYFACMYIGAHRDQKRVLGSLELELQMVVGAGN